MSTNIGPKIGIDGEPEYRKTMSSIIQQSKTLASEMKLVTASFDENTSVQERAEAQSKVLTQQIQVQEERVAELAKMLEVSATEYSIWDNRTLKWQQSLNNAKTVLVGMQKQLDSLNATMEETEPPELIFDEAATKRSLSMIEQQARTLASEMKAVTADFDENTSAQERATARSEVLAKQVEVQEQRVETLRHALRKATEQYGENDAEVLKWQQSLHEATADLKKMQREMRDVNAAMEETEPPELIFDEAGAKRALSVIEQEARTLASEMKAVTASFDENTTAQEQAAAKGKVLAQQIEAQEQRVVELTKIMWRSAEAYGDTSSETLKWRQSLNEAKADLFKMRHEMDSLNATMEETEPPELIFDEAATKRSLSVIEQEARTLASELKLLSAEFDDTTSAEDRLTQKKTDLNRQIDLQTRRVEALDRAVKQATEAYGKNDTATMRWKQSLYEAKTELIKLERELRDTERELEDVGDAADDAASPIRRAGNAMDDAAGGAFSLGKALAAGGIIEGGKAILGVVVDLIDRTEEYRRIMASLEVSSARAGYSAEETAEGYGILFGVLGDDQSSATALANLQALGVSQNDLKLLINGTVGAWSAYGDSIPIDGLAEAINETVQVGKVTGTFADVLNWAGRSEDDFNAKLEAAETQAERTAIVLQELTDQGLVDLGAAWQENNKDIVANNNATNDLNRAYARFAEMAAPAVNTALQGVADALNSSLDWWEANDEAVKTFIGDMNAAEEATVESTQVMNAALAEYAAEVEAAMVASQQATADNAMAQNEAFAEIAVGLQSMVGNMISANTQAQLSTAQMSLNVGQSFWEMQQNAGNAVLQFALDIESGVNEAADYLMGLADDAREWGRDWLQEFIDGALAKLPTLEEAAADVAAVIRKYIHFTVPDVGPLSDADEYGPDFIKLLSGGIRDHLPELEDAVNMAAESMVIQPHVIAAPQGGSVSTVNRIDGFTVNVYAAEGQSPLEVAEAVKDMIYAEVTRKEAVFGA